MDDKYLFYITRDKYYYHMINKYPILTPENIKEYDFHYQILLYTYYGYNKELINLNITYDDFSISFNYSYNNIFNMAAYKGNIKLLKYFKSKFLPYDNLRYTESINFAAFNAKLKTLKYLALIFNCKYISADIDNYSYKENPYLTYINRGYYINTKVRIIKQLYNMGFNIHYKDTSGKNILLHAAEKGKLKICKYLVNVIGLNLYSTDKYNQNIYFHSLNNIKIIKWLHKINFKHMYNINYFKGNCYQYSLYKNSSCKNLYKYIEYKWPAFIINEYRKRLKHGNFFSHISHYKYKIFIIFI